MTMALYILVLPLLLLIFTTDLLPWQLAAWFFSLLILEHINQELGRLLIALSQQHAASLNLFLRGGFWPLLAILLMIFYPELKSLKTVLSLWIIGDTLAAAFSIRKLRKLDIHGWHETLDISWIIKGIKVAIPFLIATLAIRGIFTFDRYWIKELSNLEIVGAYVLFMGLSSALISFLDAGVFSFLYPELIKAHNTGNSLKFRTLARNLLFQTLIFTCIMATLAVILLNPALSLIGKNIYWENRNLFYWSLASVLLYSFGMVPHYYMYALGKDRPIILSHLLGCIVFLTSTWLLSQYLSYLAVPISLCVAFLFILVFKAVAFHLLTPYEYKPFNLSKT